MRLILELPNSLVAEVDASRGATPRAMVLREAIARGWPLVQADPPHREPAAPTYYVGAPGEPPTPCAARTLQGAKAAASRLAATVVYGADRQTLAVREAGGGWDTYQAATDAPEVQWPDPGGCPLCGGAGVLEDAAGGLSACPGCQGA